MKLRFCLIVFGFPIFLFAQNVKFWAKADAKQVAIGEYFELTYVVENASLQGVELPELKDFIKKTDLISSVGYQNNIKTEKISITLQAKKLGVFTIPPAKIKINGQIHFCNPVTIEVVKQNIKSKNRDMFVKMIVANKAYYIGAPILLEIKSYSTIPIQSFSELNLPNLDHFISQEITNFDVEPIKEIINNIAYETRLIKKYWLYPQKTGNLLINPIAINAFIKENNFDLKSIGLQSNELVLNIKNLPDNAPKGFKGVLGQYIMSCELDKSNNARLKVLIKGIGDIKRIHAPLIIHSDSIDMLEPTLVQEKIENDTAQKVFEFILMAKQSCQSNINIIFPYFDTEKNQYQTLNKELLLDLKAVANHLKQENIEPIKQNSNSSSSQKLFYLTFILLSIAFIFYFYKNKPTTQEKLNKETIDHLEKISTNPTLSIDEIEQELRKGNISLFYKKSSFLIQNQLIKYCNLPNNSSKSVLLNQLSQSDQKNLAESINSFLNRCDAARFGGALETFDANKDLTILKEILKKINT